MAGAIERVEHVADCLPRDLHPRLRNHELQSRRLWSLTNTPSMLREMARQMTARLGSSLEIEAFDTGHLWSARQLAAEKLIEDPVLIQLCMGIRWGAPDDLNTFYGGCGEQRAGRLTFSAFSIGRNALAYPAAGRAPRRRQCPRRALKTTSTSAKGELATNAQLR